MPNFISGKFLHSVWTWSDFTDNDRNISSLNFESSFTPRNQADLNIYKKLLRIDTQLGVTQSEQFFPCLQSTFSSVFIKESVYFIKNLKK